MRPFACGTCRSLVFFENTSCETCGSMLGFDRGARDLVVLSEATPICANRALIDCNWIAGAPGELCSSCELTRTRPADSDAAGMLAFRRTEEAKRRLVYQLDDLGLPTTPRTQDPDHGLAFDLLSSRFEPVTTGHDSGVITIDMAEGDDGFRERLRVQLAEPYRTLLGHLRHEIGHWYWDVLVDDTPFLDAFHDLFGDETRDYAQSLEEHYGKPMDDSWVEDHVSHYAAAHPWEDWAESFAHYLHVRDTVQTAAAFGTRIDGPDLDLSVAWDAAVEATPTEEVYGFDELIREWSPLVLVLNSLNRSMGKQDLYPFVLRPRVLEKLRFVHVVVTSHR